MIYAFVVLCRGVVCWFQLNFYSLLGKSILTLFKGVCQASLLETIMFPKEFYLRTMRRSLTLRKTFSYPSVEVLGVKVEDLGVLVETITTVSVGMLVASVETITSVLARW